MNIKKVSVDFLVAILAQGTSALTSTLLTLALPKVLGVDDFGYWQLLVFYAGYIGFFHLGLNDGVYLVFGGTSRQGIDKREINSQFLLSMLWQIVLTFVLMALAVIFSTEQERSFVAFVTVLLIVVTNGGQFLGYLFQAMGETRLFSLSVVSESLLMLTGMIVLVVCGLRTFEPYALLYLLSKLARFCFCCIYSKDFFMAGCKPLSRAVRSAFAFIRVGMKLMFANIMGTLILGIARFLIDANWGIEVFSSVSFALSIATFFMMFISQASMVLFPALRQSGKDESMSFYNSALNLLNVFLPMIYLLYFPIVFFLGVWLPDYVASFSYLVYVLPLCLFEGKMDIVGATYLKVFRRENFLLLANLATFAMSAMASCLGTYCFHSVDLILVSVVVALAARGLVVEAYVCRLFGTKVSLTSFAAIAVSFGFIAVCLFVPNEFRAFVVFGLLAAYLFLFRKEAMSCFLSAVSAIKGKSR